MSYVVAVDIGGTFTDLVAYDHDDGKVIYTKSPTTYDNFVDGILECFDKAQVRPDQATFLNHGTTLVINAFIQRKGARAALVTTEGFRDVLEIARGNRPDPFDLHYRRDEPLIPRERRFEVVERMDSQGEVVTPLDLAALDGLAAKLKADKVDAVAVFFMNSYANPKHEEMAAARLKELLPSVYVTYSTELTREWYEYERTSTVAANAYVGPQVSAYIRRLESEMDGKGFKGSLFMMGSNGGLLSVDRTCRQPVGLVESGPIGGCIGAGAYGEALGFKNVIAFDMGGTTAKCALVENGRFSVDSVYYANGYVKGFPIKSPVIDIVEVGSGGGSIAWLDSQNRLHVGPQSAGSTPGPVCYGRGGSEPTVTDAHVVLGHLPPYLLGGSFTLDAVAARNAIRTRIAEPLGLTLEAAARGILEVLDNNMVGAMRVVSVERGIDPAELVLVPFGGAGPLHGASLARLMGCKTTLIPPAPGVLSALGLLVSNLRAEFARTCLQRAGHYDMAQLGAVFDELTQDAVAWLEAEAVPAPSRVLIKQASLRYKDQGFELDVPWHGGVDDVALAALLDSFHDAHERSYRFALRDMPIEIVTLRVDAVGLLPPVTRHALVPRGPATDAIVGQQNIAFADGTIEVPVYDRNRLGAGARIDGPAVITQLDATTLLLPGQAAEVEPYGSLIVREGARA